MSAWFWIVIIDKNFHLIFKNDVILLKRNYYDLQEESYMAKKSKVVKEQKREALVNKYYDLRKELKAKGDYEALPKLPRVSSPTR